MRSGTEKRISRVFWKRVSQRINGGADKDIKSWKLLDEDQTEESLRFALKLAGGPTIVWEALLPNSEELAVKCGAHGCILPWCGKQQDTIN